MTGRGFPHRVPVSHTPAPGDRRQFAGYQDLKAVGDRIVPDQVSIPAAEVEAAVGRGSQHVGPGDAFRQFPHPTGSGVRIPEVDATARTSAPDAAHQMVVAEKSDICHFGIDERQTAVRNGIAFNGCHRPSDHANGVLNCLRWVATETTINHSGLT